MYVITVEDGTVIGGLYGAVAEFMAAKDSPKPVRAIAIPDRYVNQGTQAQLRDECGLTAEHIFEVVVEENEKI